MIDFKSYIPFYKRNLNLALPVMITQAGQMIVQFADNIMVGHLGTTQFAGVSFANSIFLIGMVFCICFTQGLIPHVGQNYGRGNHKKVAEYFFNSFIINTIMSLLILLLMIIVIPFMDSMGQDINIIGYAKSYYTISLISLIPLILFFSIRNFSEGIGITKYAMYITIASNIINILLNWLLIYGKWGFPYLGSDGAAIATLISRIFMVISFAILIATINPYKQYLKYYSKSVLSIKKNVTLFKTSLPISLQGLVEISAFSFSGIMAGWFGKEAIAANQIAHTMVTFSFMIAQGVGVAATIRVAHQYGEKRFLDARKAGFAATHLSVAFMTIAGIIYISLHNYIPYIFTTDKEVVSIASSLLIVAAGFQIFDAMQLSGLASLRALADVKKPLYFSIFAYYCVCIPLGYICSSILGWGPVGIWIGLMLGLFFAAVLFLYRFNNITKNFVNN